MKILSEFREFISRGSVIDLAVGVIIGAAFNKIVSSAVDQVIMPPIGLATGGVDFSQLKIVLKAADVAAKKPEVAIQYGAFINTVIQFVIVAVVVFLLVKLANTMRRLTAERDKVAPPPAPTQSEALLIEIRDLLKAQAAPSPPTPRKRATPAKGRLANLLPSPWRGKGRGWGWKRFRKGAAAQSAPSQDHRRRGADRAPPPPLPLPLQGEGSQAARMPEIEVSDCWPIRPS